MRTPDALPLAKRRRSDTLTLLVQQPVLAVVIVLIMAVLGIFIIFPLYNVFRLALTDQTGEITVANLITILKDSNYLATFWNSIKLALIVASIATVVGYIFAFALTRTEMKGKRFFRTLATLPIISPPFVLSLSIIFLFGRMGLISRGLLGIRNSDVYGIGSLIIIQVLAFFPIAFMTLTGILGAIDDSVEDAAFSMGASRGHIFRTVTLPLSMPGVVSAFLLVFIQSLEDFSNPAVIAGNFSTLAVEAYRAITGTNNTHIGSMLSILLLLPTVLAFCLQRFWLKDKGFVTVTGKPTQKRRQIHEKHIVAPLFIFCCLLCGVIILFYGTVVSGAFFKTWGVNHTLTMQHFKQVFTVGGSDIKNSVILAAVSAPIGGLLGILIAYLTTRKRFLGRRLMTVSSLLTFAIPGTVLGIGYATSFKSPPILLSGTMWILVAAFVFRNMPVAIESGTTTLMQIDRSIEEASTILGASDGKTFRTVVLPLLKQAFFSGLVFAFVRAMTAVSTIIFLVSPKWSLATSRVFSLFEGSRYSEAAAYVTVMIAVILLAIGVINMLVEFGLGGRSGRQRKQRKPATK